MLVNKLYVFRHIYCKRFLNYIVFMNTIIGKDHSLVRLETLFKACSDQTRLRLIHLLVVEGEVCVGDLVGVIGPNQPKISRHLAYLKKAGIVEARKDGLWIYYRLAPQNSDSIQKVMDCLSECFMGIEVLKADLQKLRIVGKEKRAIAMNDPQQEFSPAENQFRSEQIEIELL